VAPRGDLRDDRAMVLGAVAIVVVVTWLARRVVATPGLSRFRALVPAWRFFDRAQPSPYLLIRWAAPSSGFGPWATIDDGPRGRASWLFAPEANLHLACQSAIEQLVAELGELDLADPVGPDVAETDPAIVERVSYALVSRIARARLPAALRDQPGARLQWKLVAPSDDDDSLVSVELAA
jgi:hypothetical protein